MISITVPPLTLEDARRVSAVIERAVQYDPNWNGADIELHVDPDALCASIDGGDELAGASLLASILPIVRGDYP